MRHGTFNRHGDMTFYPIQPPEPGLHFQLYIFASYSNLGEMGFGAPYRGLFERDTLVVFI